MAVVTAASIQSGSKTIVAADGTTVNVAISSVTTANSIVMYTSRNADATSRLQRHTFIASLSSSTNIQFVRAESAFASDVIVEWTVVEFDSGVLNSLQTGTSTRTSATTDVSITAVDTSKSFVIAHLKTVQTTNLEFVTCKATLVQTTDPGDTLRLASYGTPAAGESVIGYQVVEFASDADVTVQAGEITVASTNESNTATITAVDLTKAFIIHGGTYTSQGTTPMSRNMSRFKFTDASTVQLDRTTSGTTFDLTSSYYVVELQGSGHAVESFDVTITNTNTAPVSQPSWTALSTSNSAIFSGWSMGNSRTENASESIYPTDTMIAVSLDATADGATVQRTGSTIEVYLTGYAVDLSAGGGATYTLTPETGALTLTGGAVGLQFDRVLSIGTGSMTAAGGSVGLLYDRAITPETVSLSLTGGNVGTYLNRVLNPETGSLTLTCSDVVLTYTPSGFTYTLTPETGALSVTGGAVPVLHNKALSTEAGALTLTGGDNGLFYNRAIALGTGNIYLAGSPVGLALNRVIGLDTGSLTLSGSSITLTYSAAVVPSTPGDRILSLDTYARTLTANTRIKVLLSDAQNRNL